MKLKFTREILVAYEIVGWFLIIIGLSGYTPVLFYFWDYLQYYETNTPGSIYPPRGKPIFPNLPSIWFAIIFVLTGFGFILVAHSLKRTFKVDDERHDK